MKQSPTKRQREALLAIHTLTSKNGISPTLKELREELELSSDQTVIEMLERLEKGGFINRDKGQSRGIYLTGDAKKVLAIVPSINKPELLLSLEDQQQRVFEKLSGIDESLGKIYKGAIFTLGNTANDDYIAQSAHSMREVVDKLSSKGEVPKEIQDRIKDSKNTGRVVQGLQYFVDPQGVMGIGNNPYVYLYNNYQNKLNGIAHHNLEIRASDYSSMLRELEYFLLRYIFPSQLEVYSVIDNILKDGPQKTDAEDLKMLITRTLESYRYFFKNVGENWLTFLKDNGFLETKWEVAGYLCRVAKARPDDVLKIFLETEIPKENWREKTAYIEVASSLPPRYSSKTIEKIIKSDWINDKRATLLHYKVQDLLKNLISGKKYDEALQLTDALLDIFPEEYGSYGLVKTNSLISSYEYEKTIEMLAEIPQEKSVDFLKLLSEKLKKAVVSAHVKKEDGYDDYSYIWRSAIEDHEQNHSYERIEDNLISGLRDYLERMVEYYLKRRRLKEAKECVQEVLSIGLPYTVFRRIQLHFYRKFPELFSEEICSVIPNIETNSSVWHEYSLLVSQEFSKLNKKQRNKYFSAIDSLNKGEDKYVDSSRVRLVSLVEADLSKSERDKYKTLLKKGEGLEQPFFLSYTISSGFVGPDSPKSEEELKNMGPKELVEFLKSWTPTSDEFFGPSRSGLGMLLRNVVTADASRYSKNATSFGEIELRPVFVYHFLSGLVEATKSKVEMDWGQILELIINIIERAKNGSLPNFEKADRGRDRMETDWDSVSQEVARLISRGLDSNNFTLEDEGKVWKTLVFLCEHPDPTPEHEEKFGGNNTDPFTMSINTVRGDAFHALFAYIFWYNRMKKNSDKEWKLEIPEKVKRVLEQHLDKNHDPSLTIRSVYGRFFPWLFSYEKDWAKELIPKIFSEEDINLRYASWETYLSNMVFQDAYSILRPQYEQALEDIKKGAVPKRRYWCEVVDRLAEHAMISYAFELEKSKDAFYKSFFSKASGKCRGVAVSMAGRHFISRDNFPKDEKRPEIKTLQKFWDWRLKESDASSELREFGWWTKEGKFNDKWMLERLLKTVQKTKGDIDGEFIVMDSLVSLSAKYSSLCSKIVKEIFTSKNHRDGYVFMHKSELRSVLENILKNEDEGAKKNVKEVIDFLLKLGYEDMRTLGDM
jgi:DNA-binding MarR family transcriptional regulator